MKAVVEKHLLKHSKLLVAFIDVKKAYDTVNPTVLWSVLIRCGVQGRMFRMVRALHSTVQACVLSNSGHTDFHCLQAPEQGCVASPNLFSLLLNILQSAANRLCLTINLDKSKEVVFKKGVFLAV